MKHRWQMVVIVVVIVLLGSSSLAMPASAAPWAGAEALWHTSKEQAKTNAQAQKDAGDAEKEAAKCAAKGTCPAVLGSLTLELRVEFVPDNFLAFTVSGADLMPGTLVIFTRTETNGNTIEANFGPFGTVQGDGTVLIVSGTPGVGRFNCGRYSEISVAATGANGDTIRDSEPAPC